MKIYAAYNVNKVKKLAKDLVQLYYDFDYYDFVDAYGIDDFDRAVSDMYDSLINTKSPVLKELGDIIIELEPDKYDPNYADMYDTAIQLRERVEAL